MKFVLAVLYVLLNYGQLILFTANLDKVIFAVLDI